MRLRLASWNVHGWVGRDGRCDVERSFEVIRGLDAHAVALQEVRGDDWSPHAEAAGYQVVSGATLDGYGNALLVRTPLARVRRIDLSVATREPRGALDAILDAKEGRLRLIATHLGLRVDERRAQVAQLVREVQGGDEGLPTVLLGDLNDWTPGARQLAPIARCLGPLSRVATFPSRRPVLALDRVACRLPGLAFQVEAVRDRAARAASDHLPLRLTITPGARDVP